MPINFSIHIECDNCGTEFDDPDGAMEEICNGNSPAVSVSDSALEQNGWSINGSEVKCPDCKEEE
jgi:ribosomal protein S27E